MTKAAGCYGEWCEVLEKPEHDRADEGDCDIRSNNAQSADESHESPLYLTPVPALTVRFNVEANKAFPGEKVSFAALSRFSPARSPSAWLKNREINALKSP
jgi:hypothetical protein